MGFGDNPSVKVYILLYYVNTYCSVGLVEVRIPVEGAKLGPNKISHQNTLLALAIGLVFC